MSNIGKIEIVVDATKAQAEAKKLSHELDNVNESAKDAQKGTNTFNNALSTAEKATSKTQKNTKSLNSQIGSLAASSRATERAVKGLSSTLASVAATNAALNTSMMGVNQAMFALASSGDRYGRSISEQTRASRQLQKQFSSITSTAYAMNHVLASVATALTLGYAFQTLADFEKALAAVKAITQTTGTEFERLRDTAQQLGATTIFTAGEAATGMKFLAQSGFSNIEIEQAIPSTLALAQAGAIDLASASEIAAKALRGFKIDASQMNDVADVMTKTVTSSTTNVRELGDAYKYVAAMSTALNVDLRTTSATIGVLSDAGIDATMAGTALRRIFSELSNPTKKAKDLLASYGLSMGDVDIKTRGLIPVLETLKSLDLGAGAIFSLFGDRGGPGFSTIISNFDTLKERIEELQNVKGFALNMQGIMDDNLWADFKRFTSAVEYFITQTAKDSGALDVMSAGLRGIADAIRFLTSNNELLVGLVTIMGLLALKGFGTLALHLDAYNNSAKRAYTNTMTLSKATTTLRGGLAQLQLASTLVSTGTITMGQAVKGLNTQFLSWAKNSRVVQGALYGLATVARALVATLGIMAISYIAYELYELATGASEAEKAVSKLDSAMARIDASGKFASGYYEEIETIRKQALKKSGTDAVNQLKQIKSDMDAIGKEFKSVLEENVMDETGYVHNRTPISDIFKSQNEKNIENELKALMSALYGGTISAVDYRNALDDLAVSISKNQDITESFRNEMTAQIAEVKKMGTAFRLSGAEMMYLEQSIAGPTEALFHMADAMQTAEYAKRRLDASLKDVAAFNELSSWVGGLTLELEAMQYPKGATREAFEKLQKTMPTDRQYITYSAEQSKFMPNEQALTEAVSSGKLKANETKDLSNAVAELNRGLEISRQIEAQVEAERKKGSGEIRRYDNSISSLTKELNRLTMSEEAYLKAESQAKLAEFVKVLGAANPLVQKYATELDRAFKAGFTSAKDYAKAVKEFDDEMKQFNMGDTAFAEYEFREKADKMLAIHSEDGEKRIEIERYVSDKIREIRAGDLDTQISFYTELIELGGTYKDLINLQTDAIKQQTDAWLKAGIPQEYIDQMIYLQQLEIKTDWVSGVERGFLKLGSSAQDMASVMESVVTQSADSMGSALADFVLEGKGNFSDLANSILNDMARMAVQAASNYFIQQIFGGIGGMMGGMFGGGSSVTSAAQGVFSTVSGIVAHTGGIVGSTNLPTRTLPVSVFSEAPKFHSGGIVGNEVPAVLQRGEGVFTQEQMANLAPVGGRTVVNINPTVVDRTQKGVSVSSEQTTDSMGNTRLTYFIDEIDAALAGKVSAGRSSLGNSMQKSYGLSRSGQAFRT